MGKKVYQHIHIQPEDTTGKMNNIGIVLVWLFKIPN